MKKRQGRYTAAFAILLVLVLVFLVLNVCIGSVNIPVTEIPKILFGNGADDVYTDIVMGIRFPRALAAAIWVAVWRCLVIFCRPFFITPLRDLLLWVFPLAQS